MTRAQICSARFDNETVFPDGSKGHRQEEVCGEGVPDDIFGLTPLEDED